MGLLWFRHLNFIKIRIKSKFIFFEKKIYKFQINAKNLILSVSTFINSICKVNQSNSLRFAV